MSEEAIYDYSELQQRVLDKLNTYAEKHNCPVCNNDNFTIAKGISFQVLQPQIIKSFDMFGKGFVYISTLCNRCGYIENFHLDTLLGDEDNTSKDTSISKETPEN